MSRPRPFARRAAALTALLCVVAASALLACEPASAPTPTATPTPPPAPTVAPSPAPAAAPSPTPDEPATGFVLDLLVTVLGYRQDGTTEVELSVALMNDGSGPAQDSPTVTVECVLNGSPLSGCGGLFKDFDLPDRSGATESTLRLRVPMDAELRAVLDDGTGSNTVVVPERIVGVERDTWQCFSDRPRRNSTYENDFLGGCGGWTSGSVLKWSADKPVRVWADPSGGARYVRILEETLDRLAPLLDLDFEWVDAAAEATLKAYVGVPRTQSESAGFDAFCQDTVGCAGPDSSHEGAITSASMSVWLAGPQGAPLTENEIAHATLHEALHALTAMQHRPAIRSVMSVNTALRLPSLSDSDEALLRLHAHPLVRPGMTMPQVHGLIVFADELLNPPPVTMREDDGIRLAERAYAALLEAASARFDVRGEWPGPGCGQSFAGNHAIGRFARGYPSLVHFDNNLGGFFLAHADATGWQGWRQTGGQWEQGSLAQVYDATGWRVVFTDPVDMLLNVIAYAAPDDIGVTQALDGVTELHVVLSDPRVFEAEWVRGVALDIGITLDAETHHISAYEMQWEFDVLESGACDGYRVSATDGEYGIEIPLPPAITHNRLRRGSGVPD